jgi:hypothetical protein
MKHKKFEILSRKMTHEDVAIILRTFEKGFYDSWAKGIPVFYVPTNQNN